MTIRARLLATYLVVIFLGMALISSYLLWSFHAYSLASAQSDLVDRIGGVGESILEVLVRDPDDEKGRMQVLVNRHAAKDKINIRVFLPDGHLIATSAPGKDRQQRDWTTMPGVAKGLAGLSNGGFENTSGPDEIYEVRPLMQSGGKLQGVLRMSVRLEQFQKQFNSFVHSVFVALAATFILGTVLSIVLARGFALPIQKMRNFAVRMGSGHFGEKLELRRSDELGQLARELNRMSERLASLDDERRAFLANVSHELRTPVSNVRLTLEALESGADEEPELRERFIHTALEETTRLSLLVQDLLDLGRLDARVTALNRENVEVRLLIQKSVDAMEGRTRSKGLRVQLELPALAVLGDSQRLQQVIMNILDNAIKFSPREATVWISARAEGSFVRLQIRDQGPGISATDLPHVFEPFYTADPSRRRGGTGLGLAIAQRIVEGHGGTISVQGGSGQSANGQGANGQSNGAGKGSTFTVFLPAGVSAPTATVRASFTKA